MKVRVMLEVEIEVDMDKGVPSPSADEAADAFVHFQGDNLIDAKALHEAGYEMPDGERFRGYLTAKVIEYEVKEQDFLGEIIEISEEESPGFKDLVNDALNRRE